MNTAPLISVVSEQRTASIFAVQDTLRHLQVRCLLLDCCSFGSSGLETPRLTAVRIRCADHATPSTRKNRQYLTGRGSPSVGIVHLWELLGCNPDRHTGSSHLGCYGLL
jgi:hypothetical protein